MIDRFVDPYYLLLLLLLPPLAWWYATRAERSLGAVRYPVVDRLVRADRRRTGRWRHVPFGLRILALALLLIAFARPQTGVTAENVATDGIDIVLVLDLSSSMLAQDLEPNRIGAAREAAASFVRRRPNDRIGLVVFAGEAFTQAPLTLDHRVVTTLIEELEVGVVEDGTAIGMGLATAVKRLDDSSAESKVVVLLTDGRNNRGSIDPPTAAQMAQALGVRIYAVGAGTRGAAPMPVDDPLFGRRTAQVPVDIDDEALEGIASLTGGRYFRATDRESLERVYEEIDALETTAIEMTSFTRYGELFHLPLGVGLGLLLLEAALGRTVLRRLP
ncbi:MAG: VWA domain-containing protein [Acidobacteria bacterium]|nr:VWA domain-containing protein [Acidobacteriota bacterium]